MYTNEYYGVHDIYDCNGEQIFVDYTVKPIDSNEIYKVIEIQYHRRFVAISARKIRADNTLSDYPRIFIPNTVKIIPEDPLRFIKEIPL